MHKAFYLKLAHGPAAQPQLARRCVSRPTGVVATPPANTNRMGWGLQPQVAACGYPDARSQTRCQARSFVLLYRKQIMFPIQSSKLIEVKIRFNENKINLFL